MGFLLLPDAGASGAGSRDLAHVAARGSSDHVATYAQWIKNKSGTRKTAPRPAAKARPAAPPKPQPLQTPPAGAPAVPSGELQRLKDDLQRVNREISRIARESRGGRDAAKHSQLPEKQQLLMQKQDLERKIRTLA
jgi:hypothetical protein